MKNVHKVTQGNNQHNFTIKIICKRLHNYIFVQVFFYFSQKIIFVKFVRLVILI